MGEERWGLRKPLQVLLTLTTVLRPHTTVSHNGHNRPVSKVLL